jgi:hypothetical protein
MDVLPQIFAGGELGHEPTESGNAVVDVGGADGSVVVGAVVVGAVVVGDVVVGDVVVGAEVVGALLVGGVVGGVTPLLTVKSARRLEMAPLDHVSTALILCTPSTSFVVSYGSAVPLAAVPAKSKGGILSVRVGGAVSHVLSR